MKSKVVISENQKTAREEFDKIKKGLGLPREINNFIYVSGLPYMNNEKNPYIYIGNVTYTLKFRICTCIQSHLNSGFKNKFLLMSFIDVAYSLNKFSK